MKLTDIKKMTQHFSYRESAASQEQILDFLKSLGYDPGGFYQELEMSSALVDTHRDTSYSNTQLQLHSHTFYELLYCRSNCGAEYLVGTQRYRLQRGDIIFIPPGVGHRPLLPEAMPEPYKRYVIWLSPEFMNAYAHLLDSLLPEQTAYSTLLRTAGTKWAFLENLFRSGVQEAESRQPDWEAAVVGNTISLLTHLRRAVTDRSSAQMSAEKPDLLGQILTYMETHLPEHISLPETAQKFFVSPSTVSQLFRKKLGVSFYRCVTQRRLIAAKEAIALGKPMEEVAQLVGFADYSSFYRAFKQEYGISPRQYRNLQVSNPKSFG